MKQRDYILDFIKGGLIVAMLIHHALNYFGPEYHQLIRAVRFVTGSFVFMAGFTISNILLGKYSDKKILSSRLIVRGIKLILIFSILNLIIKGIFSGSLWNIDWDVSWTVNYLYDVYLVGNYKRVVFEILLPIGYILLAIGIFVRFLKHNYWIHIITFVLFMICTLLYFRMGDAYNLRYFTLGFWGLSLGCISLDDYKKIFVYFKISLIVYCTHFIFLYLFRLNYVSYTIIVLINVAFLFSIAQRLKPDNLFTKKMSFIGQYSLFSYLIQIFFLQALIRIFYFLNITQLTLIYGFILSTILTYLSVELIHYSRKKVSLIDKVYKLIFQ